MKPRNTLSQKAKKELDKIREKNKLELARVIEHLYMEGHKLSDAIRIAERRLKTEV